VPRCPGPQIARPSPLRRERDRRLGPFLRGIGRAPEHPGHAPSAGRLLRGLDGGFEGVDDRLVTHLADQGHRDCFQYIGRCRRVSALQTFERGLEAAVHVVAVVAVSDLRVQLGQVPPVLLHGSGHPPYYVAGGLRRVQFLLLRFANLFPYPVLEYLPQGIAGQVIYEHHLAGLLVGGEVLAAETPHLLGGESRVFGHYYGDHAFSELGVWQPDYCDLRHPWTTFDHFLDLAWVDVVAAADNEFFGPPAYGEVAVFADGAQIPRGEPALIVEALLSRIRPVPVAGEDVGS